jgi:anaerobic selenocysteine-containing dehydrogenase
MSEFTWVAPELVREAARFYAKSRPSAIHWGNPLEQTVHTFDAARGLICIMAICGNLDIPGGNVQANEPNIVNLGKFVRADLIPSKREEMIHAYHGTIPKLMTVPPLFFKKAVLDGEPYPVKAAYIQCANPLVAYADSLQTYEALRKLDFLAVSDIFMTPTASLADIVLPAATHFEFNDIGHFGLGHGYILARPKVVEPPEACWPDIKILNELGKSLTPAEHWPEDWEDLLAAVLAPSGLDYREFAERGYLKGPERFKKYLSSGFKTPTGKVELCLSRATKFKLPAVPGFDRLPEAGAPDYPLVLTSAKNPYFLHSSYRWVEKLRKHSPEPLVEIHPQTAADYSINEGDEVLIETPKGVITQTAHLTPRTHPGVVYAAYGWWFPEGNGSTQYEWQRSNYNMLTSSDAPGREFGTPNLKGIGCRIKKKEGRRA